MTNIEDPLKKKRNLLQNMARIIKLFTSKNKVAAVENIIAGTVANELNKISSLAFTDEMEKIAVSGKFFWDKVSLMDKLKLAIVKSGAGEKVTKMVDDGDRIRAINYVNSSIGKPLIRSVPYKQWDYKPILNEKNTYRKPGQN